MAIRVPQRQQTVSVSPVSVPRVNIPSPPSAPVIRQSFGEAVYAANAELGEVGTKIAGAFAKRAEEKYGQEQDKIIADTILDYNAKNQDRLLSDEVEEINGVQRKKGLLRRELGSAKGISQEYQEWSDTSIPKYLENIKDKDTYTKLSQRLALDALNTREKVIQHEWKQDRDDKVNSYDSNISLAKDMAYAVTTPPDLEIQINNATVAQAAKNRLLSLDDATAQSGLNKTKSEVIENGVMGALQRDVTGNTSFSLLDAFRGKLDAKQYDEINDNIQKEKEKIALKGEVVSRRALNQKEEEVATKVNDGTYDIIQLKQDRAEISEKYYGSVMRYLKSPKTVNAKTDLLTYEDVMQNIINRDMTASEIRSKIYQAGSEGKLSQSNIKHLLYVEKGGGFSTIEQDYMEEMRQDKTKQPVKASIWGTVWDKVKTGTASIVSHLIMGNIVDQVERMNAKTEDDVMLITSEAIRKQTLVDYPWISKLPINGRLAVDAYGNKAIVYPDGIWEEVEDAEGNFTPQQKRKKSDGVRPKNSSPANAGKPGTSTTKK